MSILRRCRAVAILLLSLPALSWAQGALPPVPAPVEAPAAAAAGVEVLARGPIHEAFASPATAPVATTPVNKTPPPPIEEMPPAEKPEGNAVWIGGYWAWDDDRADFLWVSGVWRVLPPEKTWVAGYWRPVGTASQWVPGFYAPVRADTHEVAYLPAPPEPPRVAPPGTAPTPDSFYVPGAWAWGGRAYRWRAGYWGRVQPGYVWVADHYRWTPTGYVYVPGYWDLALSRRGILFAPVVIRPRAMVAGFSYTPAYAVNDVVILDSMFVRPATCHYYFGDYYGPRYAARGFQSAIVYSQRHYEPVMAYEIYQRRRDPRWVSVQIALFNNRSAGRAPLPPRTLVAQTAYIARISGARGANPAAFTLVAPTARIAAARGTRVVVLDSRSRQTAHRHVAATRRVTAQRLRAEGAAPRVGPHASRTVKFTVARPAPRLERRSPPHPRPVPPAARRGPGASQPRPPAPKREFRDR